MSKKLTVGIATHTDFEGIWPTLESLHAHHPHVPYLVIDNAPTSCTRTRGVTLAVGGKYLHRPDLNGTSAPRDALFRLATTPWVMCLDSHVLLETGAVQALLDYIDNHPDSNDLLTGPMIYDDGLSTSTHWRQDKPPGLWGVWDTDKRAFPGCTTCPGGEPGFRAGLTTCAPYRIWNEKDFPHAKEVWERWTEPFEIPMQGLGLFAMRCQAWPGFHPLFTGFGGEEGYIHEKVRQRGGRNLCLPPLRWRHRFRHMEHGAPPPPYRLAREDHTWNLLVGHRELGIEATKEIREVFGNTLPPGVFDRLAEDAAKKQPFGVRADRKRLKLLGVWYTNSQPHESLLRSSLATIQRAQNETMHHDVQVTTSSWTTIPGNPFPCMLGKPDVAGHAAIIEQIGRCIKQAEKDFDGILFLEHDVLYPPGYFDRMGDALASGCPVVSNLDYEGLNATGFLAVKERHEPFHSLGMRKDFALSNLARAEADCKLQGWAYLEPQGERNDWVRLPPIGLTPTIHVNW